VVAPSPTTGLNAVVLPEEGLEVPPAREGEFSCLKSRSGHG
jgi:hypothetical protein